MYIFLISNKRGDDIALLGSFQHNIKGEFSRCSAFFHREKKCHDIHDMVVQRVKVAA